MCCANTTNDFAFGAVDSKIRIMYSRNNNDENSKENN
jgi:hypothetical protein